MPIIKQAQDSTAAPTAPAFQKEADLVSAARELLLEEYYASDKCREEDTVGEKHILNVAWFDTDFNKVASIERGKMISIAVLTKGYSIGDTINVTIGDETNETLGVSSATR